MCEQFCYRRKVKNAGYLPIDDDEADRFIIVSPPTCYSMESITNSETYIVTVFSFI